MQFGDSFLPESGWTLTNATMNAGSLVISAGGSASITLTEVENTNLLPEALQVILTASSYTPTYAPTSFARIHVEYEDNNTYDAILPIVNNFNGFMTILWPSISNYEGINVGAFTSLTFSIFSSTGITLSSWSLAKSLNDYLKTDTLYHGIRITTKNGFEAIRSDKYARAYFNSDTFAMQVGDGNGNWTDVLYFDSANKKYVFDGELTARVIKTISDKIEGDLNLDSLGDMAYEDAVEISKLGETIIEGGYLKTGLVDATRIDTGTLNANRVKITCDDPDNGQRLIQIGKLENHRFGIRIKGTNGELMIDEYGIDPRFIKAYKNVIWNSSFERFDPATKIPSFWSAGESVAGTAYDNTRSMMIQGGEFTEQLPSSGGYTSRPDPESWGGGPTRVSFMKKGGPVQVQIFSEYDWSPFILTDEDGNQSSAYNTDFSENWNDGQYTFSFVANKPGRCWVRISSISNAKAYVDAVQMEPDFNGKYPSFYSNGPFSVGNDDSPLSDTWIEYVNVPYASVVNVEFNQPYVLAPSVNASLIRNRNAPSTGGSGGGESVNFDIRYKISSDGVKLLWTGATIVASGPSNITDGYVSVQIIGRR